MKIRTDFVTNSSSSSFIISKKNLSKEQIEGLLNFDLTAEELHLEGSEYANEWYIYDEEDTIEGNTFMDDFSAIKLFKALNIPESSIIHFELLD